MMYASTKFEFMGARMRDWMWNRFLCTAHPDTSLPSCGIPSMDSMDLDSHLKIVHVNGRDIWEGIAQPTPDPYNLLRWCHGPVSQQKLPQDSEGSAYAPSKSRSKLMRTGEGQNPNKLSLR